MTKTFLISPRTSQLERGGQTYPARRMELRFYWEGALDRTDTSNAFSFCTHEASQLLAAYDHTSALAFNRNGIFIRITVTALEKDIEAHRDVLKSNGFKESKESR